MLVSNSCILTNSIKPDRTSVRVQPGRTFQPAVSFAGKDTVVWCKSKQEPTGLAAIKQKILNKLELRKQVKVARDLGVIAEFSCEPGLAKTVNESFQLLKDQGYKLPKRIYCGDKYFENYEDPDALAVVDKKKGVMWMKSSMMYGSFTDTNTKIRPFKFLVLHEVGHYNLFQSYEAEEGEGSYKKFYEEKLYEDQVTDELGIHATINMDELCADVFAKLAGGEKVSDDMMKIYKANAGKHLH